MNNVSGEGAGSVDEFLDRDVSVRPLLVAPVLLLIVPGRDLLEKVGDPFPFRAPEAHEIEELEDSVSRALVDDLPLREQDDVVEEVESFGLGLEKRDEHRRVQRVDRLLQELDDLKGRGRVQAVGYLVQE